MNYVKNFEYYINIGKNKFPKLFLYTMRKILSNEYISFNDRNYIMKMSNISNDIFFEKYKYSVINKYNLFNNNFINNNKIIRFSNYINNYSMLRI